MGGLEGGRRSRRREGKKIILVEVPFTRVVSLVLLSHLNGRVFFFFWRIIALISMRGLLIFVLVV